MTHSRLTLALDSAAPVLPAGRVRVLRPPAAYDLTALDRARVEIDHGFKPDHDAWSARGYAAAGDGPVPTVVVVVPRSKALARRLVSRARQEATDIVIVDGARTDGVDSLYKACRGWAPVAGSLSKAHGRLFWFSPEGTPDWAAPDQRVEGFRTQPGVFSEGKVDPGSRLLAGALPPLSGRVADLGAGWGYLSAAVLDHPGVTHLDMIEAEALALDCLTENIADPRAHALWADATRFSTEARYDAVVMNPPFHSGRKGVPEIGQAFLATAARLLKPAGHLYLVANRHLPYEARLRELFAQVQDVGGDQAFKLISATRPRR
ncbi:class I SAM-dependent methyltransferase [Salibaculum halophilum]|uniref:class I SAM-dependent methyltransferase n=1 Tax=Salibaculum halophilum TaxID=1914408 RepID=UPI000A121184|nr:methyltransferase [Salibaculum halophilum]